MKLKQAIALIITGCFAVPLALAFTASAASSDLLFGQQHSYSVTMRGNGEAVVLARIVFSNISDQPQQTFEFTIPGTVAPSDLVGYQQQYQQVCNRYGASTTPVTSAPANGSAASTVAPAILPCLEYAVPDYTSTIVNQSVNYQKLTFTSQGSNRYQVKLPTPVPAQQSSALLLSYSTMAYAQRSLGAYKFTFQTIKVYQRISSANVAVSVDSDQYLEGKSSVTYRTTAPNTALSGGAAAPSSAALNQISANIGQSGEIDKQASDLAPGDTLTVKGRYASSNLLLRLPGLLMFLGFLVLVGVLLLIFRRRIAAHFHRQHHPAPDQLEPAADPGKRFANAGNILAGLVSALGIVGLTWFLSWYGQSNAYNSPDDFTTPLIMITAILAYILFGLGPAIYLAATNRDWRRLVFTLAFEVLFLVAFVLIYALGIAPLLSPPGNQVDPGIINSGAVPN
jgi:hypothetical protein